MAAKPAHTSLQPRTVRADRIYTDPMDLLATDPADRDPAHDFFFSPELLND